MTTTSISVEDARWIGEELGVDWGVVSFDEFRLGMEVELEHGRRNRVTNVTNDDLLMTGKIALAHLAEFPDYYQRLAKMEAEAHAYWARRK
jgi:hypothetical protein